MSGMETLDPIDDVKLRWARTLAPLMPAATGQRGKRVPVFYAYPGDDHVQDEMLFLSGGVTDLAVHSLRAATRRRVLTSEFLVVAQVRVLGDTQPGTDPLKQPAQHTADRRASTLIAVAENHIATDEHLACPDLIDKAWAGRITSDFGTSDTGAWTRKILTVRFEARIL